MTPNPEPQPMTGFRQLVAVGTIVNGRSLSAVSTILANLMKSILPGLLTGSLLLSTAMAGETSPSTGGVIKDVPLGHKDFYPSTERPVGFRGDDIVTADISNPAAVRILGDRNLLQEAGPASDIYVEQYLNGTDPFLFAGCYHGSASWFGGLMGSMTPSGNRVFIQSATHLRCLGDPAVKYDWNPQSRPEAITNALKTKTPSTKEP